MNRLRKYIKYFGILLVLLTVFRGFLYRVSVTYSKVAIRNNITLTDKKIINEIDKHIEGKILSIEDIIKLSNKITSKKLQFTFDKVSSDPNTVAELQKANCIGYSSLFNSIGNYILNKKNLTDRYEFIHLVGKLDFFGVDLHALFNSPFFKDHDFNEIKDKQTGNKKFIDPSLRDYLRIEYITSLN